ncbi:hypothetical protein CPB86DRAFT_307241 [Serendipita vermifera]|nr:hypothetical protein CPB86DRAFT_307241 [Serendipita vermifera]
MRPAISTYAFLLASFALVAGAPTEDVDVDNEGVYTLQYAGNWTVSRTDTSSHGGSSSYTTTRGDAFELRFNGTSIEFYGTSSPASAKFAVHLDGTSHGTCNTTVTENPANNVLLWSLGNLSNDTEHVFHVAHNDTDGKILSLDWLSSVSSIETFTHKAIR